MNYKDLQDKAKALGLRYVSVSRAELIRTIAEKTGVSAEAPSQLPTETQPIKADPTGGTGNGAPSEPVVEQPMTPPAGGGVGKAKRGRPAKENVQVKPTPETPKEVEVPKDTNTATVYDGSFKVRAYTLQNHGENFIELAKSFVEGHPTYRIEFTKQLPALRCPNCGSVVRCGTCGKALS
jgi:hypothetical protein